MSAKRGTSGLSGILLVDKPSGLTSHDVVDRVRRATGERRVGHAGTLDPMATGLLVVLVGPATRLAPYLTSRDKVYEAVITLGTSTDTDDAEGQTTGEAAVPDGVFQSAFAQATLDDFIGPMMQVPPAYSAIKVGGTTAHRAAREGAPLELAARPIEVFEATLLGVDASRSQWTVRFVVSKGTYIRSLARDIGDRLGTRAHLSALRRVSSGTMDVADASSLDDIASHDARSIHELFVAPRSALSDLPSSTADAEAILSGRRLIPTQGDVSEDDSLTAVYLEDGSLGGLYRARKGQLVAETVMAIPVSGDRSLGETER